MSVTFRRTCTAVFLAVLTITLAHGEVILSAAARQQLEQALSRPVNVYSTDARAGEAVMARVDLWAGSQIDLRKAKTSSRRNATRTTYLSMDRENRPIWPERSQGRGITASRPYLVRYTKEPGKRSFTKDLHVPTPRRLAPNDVSAIARRFVDVNGLCKSTSADRYGETQVVARVRSLDSDSGGKTDSTFTLFQRAILKRQLSGLEVVNSKQIVDVHPDSREILGYENIDWTPVNETAAAVKPYKTRERVLAEIDSAFLGVRRPLLVERTRLCYYQTDSLILPVLAVYPQRDTGDSGIRRRVVYIGLADVSLGQPRTKNPRRPTSPR